MIRQHREVVQALIALVYQAKDLEPIILLLYDLAGKRAQMHIATLLNYSGHPLKPVGQGFRYKNLVLNPVSIFFKAHSLQVIVIIRVIVNQAHGAQPVVAGNKHTLRVEIGKAQRTDYRFHSIFAAEFINSLHQGIRHLTVINEVIPAETDFFMFPLIVSFEIDYRSYTSYKFSVFIGQIQRRFAKLLRCPLFLIKSIHLIKNQRRNIIRIVLVEPFRKQNKPA